MAAAGNRAAATTLPEQADEDEEGGLHVSAGACWRENCKCIAGDTHEVVTACFYA
jgi:hypothetical protein